MSTRSLCRSGIWKPRRIRAHKSPSGPESESTDVLSTLIVSLAVAFLRIASATACCFWAEGSEERELVAVGPWLAQAANVRTRSALKINRMNVSDSKKCAWKFGPDSTEPHPSRQYKCKKHSKIRGLQWFSTFQMKITAGVYGLAKFVLPAAQQRERVEPVAHRALELRGKRGLHTFFAHAQERICISFVQERGWNGRLIARAQALGCLLPVGKRCIARLGGASETGGRQRIFVGAVNQRGVGKRGERVERIQHLLRCAFKQTAAAAREQG